MNRQFYVENRRRLATHMADGDAMLFFSGESQRKTADENFPFFTNRNFLYLTGLKQEQSALLLQKKGDLVSECLLVTKPDLEREIWTGRRFTEEEINELTGVAGMEDINNLRRIVDAALSSQQVMTLWLCFDALAPERSFDIEREFAKRIQNQHPHVVIRNSYPLLAAMRKIKADGELILSDVGAPYDEYCTDISRVFPANGHFNERQAQLYQVAYATNRAVMAQVRPGVFFPQLNRTCRDFAFEGLKSLGLLEDIADIRKHVWHGVTHHVGLDTHDVGGYDEPMAENMVFVVDAGIYVREWGIGLRLEDNVLVTADGCENLSAGIPATIEEIESLMISNHMERK